MPGVSRWIPQAWHLCTSGVGFFGSISNKLLGRRIFEILNNLSKPVQLVHVSELTIAAFPTTSTQQTSYGLPGRQAFGVVVVHLNPNTFAPTGLTNLSG